MGWEVVRLTGEHVMRADEKSKVKAKRGVTVEQVEIDGLQREVAQCLTVKKQHPGI